MNYKEKYVHSQNIAGLKKAETLPVRAIQEVAIFSLSEGKIFVKEKKVKINGVNTNYFSTLFLECQTSEIQDSEETKNILLKEVVFCK